LRGAAGRAGRRALRPCRGRRRPARDQSLLPVAVRHRARVRPCHPSHRVAGGRHRRAARRRRRPGGLLGAAPPQRPVAPGAMTARTLAWRAMTADPARATLAVAGVAIIGALLFDMLLLSRGLLVSLRQMLDSAGYDVRIVASEGFPI